MTNFTKRDTKYVYSKSPKRLKRPDQPIYSTRVITWEEQQRLPKRFREEEGVWPAVSILDERGSGAKTEYLLEWESHPETGEIFEPTWEPKANVGKALLNTWRTKQQREQYSVKNPSPRRSEPSRRSGATTILNGSEAVRRSERSRTRRGTQDHSSDFHFEVGTGYESRTPTLIDSPASSIADSLRSRTPLLEISETQQSINTDLSSRLEPYNSGQINIRDQSSDLLSPASTEPANPKANLGKISKYPIASSSKSSRAQQTIGLSPSTHQKLIQAVQSPNSAAFPGRSRISISALLSNVDQDHHSQTSQQGSGSASLSISDSQKSLASSIVITNRSTSERQHTSGSSSKKPEFSQSEGYSDLQNSRSWSFEAQIEAQEPTRGRQLSAQHRKSSLIDRGKDLNTQRQSTQSTRVKLTEAARKSQLTRQGNRTFSMATSVPRQSPRLQSATPVKTSTPTQSTTGDGSMDPTRPRDGVENVIIPNQVSYHEETTFPSTIPDFEHNQPPIETTSLQQLDSTSAYSSLPAGELQTDDASDLVLQAQGYNATLPSLPIQQSIEDEAGSSTEDQTSLDSKASSSQQSLDNERIVPQVDGLVLPTHPVLGQSEYTLALPAEGKVQSTYADTIKSKRKAILRFVHRRESIGSANGSTNKTVERNEMIELIQRLHDTTTHLDLGLPDFSTQYSTRSEEHAAYADYAGSKFAFLGHLVDIFKRTNCSIAILTQSGTIQDLLEDYLGMKQVQVKRADRSPSSGYQSPTSANTSFTVDLVSTTSVRPIELTGRPVLILAFDSTFDPQDQRLKDLRERYAMSPGLLVPVIHLLVTNSSEHVDRCLPKSMPSPQRLKLLVRATYQARTNLGGMPTYVPDPSDEPINRPMDLSDLQRAVRKSPDRKLSMMASILARAALSPDFDSNWTLGNMPELQLDELEDASPKLSKETTAATTPKDGPIRSRTPLSRADTPSGRKRLLDVDIGSPALIKRQRLTPLQDMVGSEANRTQSSHLEQLQQSLEALKAELALERDARRKAEESRNYAQQRLEEWTGSLADLQRRYERRTAKSHKLEKSNKALLTTIENGKARQERHANDNTSLKEQVKQLQADLNSARTEMKNGGGDLAALEDAREEARASVAKVTVLERSLDNTKRDFEFTRQQYQQASNRAAELANQVSELESQEAELKAQAADEKRKLKEMNFQEGVNKHLSRIEELELEKKSREAMIKKMEEEIRNLKKNRGVQTRGSSVQPPGSPGPRSRQASPASGFLAPVAPREHIANRASALRHER